MALILAGRSMSRPFLNYMKGGWPTGVAVTKALHSGLGDEVHWGAIYISQIASHIRNQS